MSEWVDWRIEYAADVERRLKDMPLPPPLPAQLAAALVADDDARAYAAVRASGEPDVMSPNVIDDVYPDLDSPVDLHQLRSILLFRKR